MRILKVLLALDSSNLFVLRRLGDCVSRELVTSDYKDLLPFRYRAWPKLQEQAFTRMIQTVKQVNRPGCLPEC